MEDNYTSLVLNPDNYYGDRSYKAALYALGLANKANKLLLNGHTLRDEYECYNRGSLFVLDTDTGDISLKDGNTRVLFVGDVTDSETGKIHCTKKSIDEFFNSLTFMKEVKL